MEKIFKRTLLAICFLVINTSFCDDRPLKDVVVALDFHGVVARANVGTMLSRALTSLAVARKLAFFGAKKVVSKVSDAISFKKDLNPGRSIDYYFDNELREGRISQAEHDAIVSVYASFTPDTQLIATIAALRKLGATIVLHSNIGATGLNYIFAKNPELRDLFDGFRIADKENNYASKTDPASAKQLEALSRTLTPNLREIIMVDDSTNKLALAKCTLGAILTPLLYKSSAQFKAFMEEVTKKSTI